MSARGSGRWVTVLAIALLAASGCALTSKSKVVTFRYFTPGPAPGERPMLASSSSPSSGLGGAAVNELLLRLRGVKAASYIRDRIAFRNADREIGYYGTLRWAEQPEAYLRRALARALFEEHGVREIVSGAGPTLEVDLDAFEELRAPPHAARVELTWRLRDDRTVLIQRTLTVERPIPAWKGARHGNAVAAAMADALGEAVDRVVDAVLAELRGPPSDIAGRAVAAQAR